VKQDRRPEFKKMYFYLMKLVVIPKNKKQEKALRNFLEESAIDFTIAAEDAAIYKTTHSKKVATKQTDASSEKSPAGVPEWQKQFVRKSIKKYNTHPELLISEKEAWAIIESSK